MECLNNYYISANTLPQYIVERNFTGIRTTNAGKVSYLTSPVTNTISGNFVTFKGNNGAFVTVDSRATTPITGTPTLLIAWVSSCNTSNASSGGNSIDEIAYGGALPPYIPTNNLAKHFVTEEGQEWYFSNFIWYFNGVLKQNSPPAVQTVVGGVTYNYSYAIWYDQSTNTYNRYYSNCSCWKPFEIVGTIDTSYVRTTTAQNIWGEKTFKNKLSAKEGMDIEGGAKMAGASSKAATTINGVVKGKRRLITSDSALDGTDFFIEVQCSTIDITINLPAISSETEGWKFDINRTDNTNFVVKFQRPDGSFIKILNKRSTILRNNGTNWFFD